jgi:hypothetical protein
MRNFIDIITEAMSRAEAVQIFADQGVNVSGLDDKTLKAAHRKLARSNHPDAGGDVETMKQINAAYDVLAAQGTGPSRTSAGSQSTGQSARPESGDTTWAWAGHSGGGPPSTSISRPHYTDMNYVKKRMWELSGKSREEWSILSFDGNFFRGMLTVYGSEEIFDEMAEAMRVWDRFHKARAIFVQKRGEQNIRLIWLDGSPYHPPFEMEHDSFNFNPSNDQSFVRRLPDMLDRLSQRKQTRARSGI